MKALIFALLLCSTARGKTLEWQATTGADHYGVYWKTEWGWVKVTELRETRLKLKAAGHYSITSFNEIGVESARSRVIVVRTLRQ